MQTKKASHAEYLEWNGLFSRYEVPVIPVQCQHLTE